MSEANRRYHREKVEPDELKNPVPLWYTIMAVGFILWGGGYFYFQVGPYADAGDHRTPLPIASLAEADGGAVYSANCAGCHQSNGQGVTGAFPPLAGAGWVLADEAVPVQILLHGVVGDMEVNGVLYNGVMPSMAHLSDAEIAAVLTYIRGSWGNTAEPVTRETVTAGRDAFPADRGPWQGGAELEAEVGPPAAADG